MKDKLQVSNSILETIGDTPLVRLKNIFFDSKVEVYGKLESFNPSGSVKARTSYNILQKAMEAGELRKGDTVIESSSGNMAIGLAQACLVMGLKLIVVVDPKLNKLTSQLLETYGTTIEMVTEPLEEGGFLGARLAKVKELLKTTKNSFWSNQYGNLDNPKTHYQTTKEIYEALDGRLDYLFVATSTCGTLMGCADYIKANHPNTKIIAVDAVGSVLFGGEAGTRKIPGHGAGVNSQFLNEDYIHDFVKVNDLECAVGCWELLEKESILVGGSSGAIIKAFQKYEHQMEEGSRCAFILSDGGSRYLDTIFNQEWLLNNIPGAYDALTPVGGWKIKPSSEYNVAIVGLGPKGLYGLERLLAHLKSENVQETVNIHLYNNNQYFGAGDVYRMDQPDFLKMNFANTKIDVRSHKQPESINNTGSYVQWLSASTGIDENQLKDKFSSRKMVGEYLSASLEDLISSAPENIKIHRRIQEVINITENEGLLQLETRSESKDKTLVKVHNVLLTTGHAGNRSEVSENKGNSSNIDFVYPVEKKLAGIQSNSIVAIKGMGLTFIDAALALTEGRGGRFNGDGENMQYLPLGNEPAIIYPYSRSGALMIPRVGEMPKVPKLRFFTSEKLNNIRKNFAHKFDFSEELLLLIRQEFTYRYYKLAFRNLDENLKETLGFSEMLEEIEIFHKKYPSEKRFSFEELQSPFLNSETTNTEDVAKILEETISMVSFGVKSPLLAAISAWHDISPIFNELYSFGGLTARSHQIFDHQYAPFFNRISYGPPLENMYKVLALIKAVILDFSFAKSPEVKELQYGKFELSNFSSEADNTSIVDYHIDARIPKMKIPSQSSLLFRNLFGENKMQLFQNTDETGNYETGGLDLTKEGHPINIDGKCIDNITIYGTPTEGVTFDNDTLSRNRNDFSSIWAKNVIHHFKKNISNSNNIK
ncbi:2,3-diaminopropionate biosynthesis protein SbnA [Zunongwangia endophytica]|uniref:N-(2-amino-2-carboxyethyl)-L-glutamate synthase n=1 Tax=Zunongwangia endophytica TaxID=1808945 RepID=A0ABV8HDK2_9FLAO|nr:2,3-diaminopropionate biosynthesis protein SbnA [Zunongwangia endophytica]MDN3593488.1 2,3-diaminopropionate biosynthesis protein SbnA [Zunongwangia endophytica]